MTDPVLFARSHFSIGESILKISDIVEQASLNGYGAIALTDTMTVSGMIDLTNRCKKEGIKPIVGVRLCIVDDPTLRGAEGKATNRTAWYLKLYALNQDGIERIYRLLTLANSDERYYYIPRLGLDDVLSELDPDALAVSTGDVLSALHRSDAVDILQKVSDAVTSSQTFVELCPISTPLWDRLNARAISIANALDLPTLVTRPAFYKAGDGETMEIMNAISRNVKVDEIWHYRPVNKDSHVMTRDEMGDEIAGAINRLEDRYPKLDQGKAWSVGLENADKLAALVEFEWAKADVSLPQMAKDEFKALFAECAKGWKTRFGSEVFGHEPSKEDLEKVYKPRLAYEVGILKKMGFSGYFLLVQDMVNWAKSSGINVGPGRGSVGGSLVAYLMGITDVDPIRFNLLFERFINPDRLDLPDIDLDFMSERRHEVVEYLVEKYGADRVAGISNYGTLGSASALRDTGRVYALDNRELAVTKLVPDEHGQRVSLEKAAEEVGDIALFKDKYPTQWRHATKLEGVMRSLGKHAAGTVVAGEPLVGRAVVERRSGEPTINWDKRVAEDQGLVKIDILGLSTLDILKLAQEEIWKRHSKKIDLLEIPLDDKEVLAAFAKGDTVGIFQFESVGMRKLLKDLGQYDGLTFEDVAAATALYRPGPMDSGMMEQFVARKTGGEGIYYENPNMEPALKDTYGVAVYQEQVMRLATDVAGFTLPEADHLRKAMGKKDKDKMAEMRDKWVAGCLAHSDMAEGPAGTLFDKVEAFAGYGFNKSHAVEYSLISYVAMWLKVKYPVEFYAGALTVLDKDDKIASMIGDARERGIEVLPPDINISSDRFEILNDVTLCIPFNKVKGISHNTTNAILKARNEEVTVKEEIAGTKPKQYEEITYPPGDFINLQNFLARVEKRRCNKRHVENLTLVGAFARIVEGSLAANHPDRRKNQLELMPGLVIDTVKVDRDMKLDKFAKARLVEIVKEYRALPGSQPKVKLGKKAKFMVVTDAPTWAEEQGDQIAAGKTFGYLSEALYANGLSKEDGYWTCLSKTIKEGKFLEPDQVAEYAPFLQREIDILKPPVIIMLGTASLRHFIKDFKGSGADRAGKVVFDPGLDASLVIGFNPAQIAFDDKKQDALNKIFEVVAEMLV